MKRSCVVAGCRTVTKPGLNVCTTHQHVTTLQTEIVRLQTIQGDPLTMLLRQYPPLRRLIENVALAADRAQPMKAAGSQVVARSRGHNQSDGIVIVGERLATPGYAVATMSDRGRLGAVLAAVSRCGEQVDRILDPSAPKRRDDRPRCGSRACDKRNVRQPVGIRVCGFCGRDMRQKVEA
jgi:hypothetical protein